MTNEEQIRWSYRGVDISSSMEPNIVYEIHGPKFVFPNLKPSLLLREEGEAEVIAKAPQMLEALLAVRRALSSQEWREWEGKAMTMEIRERGHEITFSDQGELNPPLGYHGEQFMHLVHEAIPERFK